jgi:hypothetical protein
MIRRINAAWSQGSRVRPMSGSMGRLMIVIVIVFVLSFVVKSIFVFPSLWGGFAQVDDNC